MNRIIRPFQALVFADEKAFVWTRKKLDFSAYQMALLTWLKVLLIGLLFGYLFF